MMPVLIHHEKSAVRQAEQNAFYARIADAGLSTREN